MPNELINVNITGIEEVCARLTAAPQHIVKRAFAQALSAAAVPIVESLEAHTPERSEGDRNEDLLHLKDSIVTDIAISAEGQGGRAQVGFGKMGDVARFVEYGHRAVGHKPASKVLGTVQPHPFMRPAAADSGDAAIQAFGDALIAALPEEI